MPFRLRTILAVVLCAGVSIGLTISTRANASDQPVSDGLRAAVAREIALNQVREFMAPIVMAGISAELERAAVFVNAVTPPPVVAQQPGATAQRAIPPAGGGGGHSDAWWQGVAMCEQGGRNDPYYGYFSFMDGSQGGRPWAEQVAAGNALLASAGREIGPWAAACVAAGYRAAAW